MTDLAVPIDSSAMPQGVATLDHMGDSVVPALTVIVPVGDEYGNVPTLLRRLGAAVAPLSAEILLVGNSDGDIMERLTRLAPDCHVPTRGIHGELGGGGPSAALIAGARRARGHWILVMDTDLPHSPEAVAMLARTAMRHDADIVIGARGTGSVADLDGATRLVAESSAAGPVESSFTARRTGRRPAAVSDLKGRLFAFRREAVDLDRLRPLDSELLLELLMDQPGVRIVEVASAAEMAPCHAGDSPARRRQGLMSMSRLLLLKAIGTDQTRGQRSLGGFVARIQGYRLRILRFGLVGASCFALQYAIMSLLARIGVTWSAANAAGFVASAQLNFLLSAAFTWGDRKILSSRRIWPRWLSYNGTALIALAANTVVFSTALQLISPLPAAFLGVIAGTVVTYLICNFLIFRSPAAHKDHEVLT